MSRKKPVRFMLGDAPGFYMHGGEATVVSSLDTEPDRGVEIVITPRGARYLMSKLQSFVDGADG